MALTHPKAMPKPHTNRSRRVRVSFTSGAYREIREGMGLHYKLLAILHSGDIITLYGPPQLQNRQMWAWVKSGAIEGFMVIDLARFDDVPEDATKPTLAEKAATQESEGVKPDVELTRKILLTKLSLQLHDLAVTFGQLAGLEGEGGVK